MDERLKRLAELRAQAVSAIEALTAERAEISDLAKSEDERALTVDETAEFRAKTAGIKAEQDKIDSYDSEIAELEEERARAGRQSETAKSVAKSVTKVEVTSEARTYEKGNGVSYVQDLMKRHFRVDDDESAERLRRHAAEVRTDKEFRDLNRTDGTGGYQEVATAA